MEKDEQIKIFLKLTKTIQLNVKNSDLTGVIKAIVEEQEGITASNFTLTLDKNQLNADQTLGSCGIHNGSVLSMYQTHVNISVISSSTPNVLKIRSKITDLIRTIKFKIQSCSGIPEDQQILYYDGKRLEDNQSLISSGIFVDTNLHLVKLRLEELNIIVKMLSAKIIDVKVMAWFTVQDLMMVLESKLGSSCGKFTLDFNGQILECGKMLATYNIQCGSTIRMVAVPDLQIFIRVSNGKNIVLPVNSYETIGSIIVRCREQMKKLMNIDIPNLKLRFGVRQLDSGKTLACYKNIQRDCTLDIVYGS